MQKRRKNKQKEAGMGPLKKNIQSIFLKKSSDFLIQQIF